MKIKKSISIEENLVKDIEEIGNSNFSKGLDIKLLYAENDSQVVDDINNILCDSSLSDVNKLLQIEKVINNNIIRSGVIYDLSIR